SPIVEDRSDDVNLLAVVDLVPKCLENSANRGSVRVTPVHQARHVFEADITGLQLFMIQDAHAAVPHDRVALERKVHFVDAVALGARTELGLGSRGSPAEEDAVARLHPSSFVLHWQSTLRL